MAQELTFYIHRQSIIHALNPLTKLTYVAASVGLTFTRHDLITPIVLFAFTVGFALAARLGREFFSTAIKLVIPAITFLFLMQSFFLPGTSETYLNIWFLRLDQVNVLKAANNSARILNMISIFLLFILTTHPSKLMSDLSRRGLPPQIVYTIGAALQIIPSARAKAFNIQQAQQARGLDTTGSLIARAKGLLPLAGPLIISSIMDVEKRTIAIEARGFMSKQARTQFIDIPDSPIEKLARWVILLLLVGLILWR